MWLVTYATDVELKDGRAKVPSDLLAIRVRQRELLFDPNAVGCQQFRLLRLRQHPIRFRETGYVRRGAQCFGAYVRGSQGNRTPFEVFEFLSGKGTAAKLHIARIDPKEVILKPRLVGIEMK